MMFGSWLVCGAASVVLCTAPVAQWSFSEAEVLALERKAIDGDPDAAFAVMEHYGRTKGYDAPENLFWLQIAAENGHVIGMTHYAADLSYRGGMTNCRRAVFWIDRALSSPDLRRWADPGRFKESMGRFRRSVVSSGKCAAAFRN